jgi:hypothetical protein
MSALPMHPTERDRERFRDLTKAIVAGLEYNRCPDGEYREATTQIAWRIWWSVERERQLLQNLNQSQGRKLSEMGVDLEKAESELEAERKRLDWALEKAATFYEWQGKHYLSYDVPENDGFDVLETDNPRATIDELIAGEPK